MGVIGGAGRGSVEVLFFGRLRQAMGAPQVVMGLPAAATVASVWREAVTACPRPPADPSSIRAAVNEAFVTWDTVVADGDRIAFMPPLCGG